MLALSFHPDLRFLCRMAETPSQSYPDDHDADHQVDARMVPQWGSLQSLQHRCFIMVLWGRRRRGGKFRKTSDGFTVGCLDESLRNPGASLVMRFIVNNPKKSGFSKTWLRIEDQTRGIEIRSEPVLRTSWKTEVSHFDNSCHFQHKHGHANPSACRCPKEQKLG